MKFEQVLRLRQTAVFVSATKISDDHIEYCNAACIIENMLLQAAAPGLGGTYFWDCLRKLRANEAVLKKLQLPDGYIFGSLLAESFIPDTAFFYACVSWKICKSVHIVNYFFPPFSAFFHT